MGSSFLRLVGCVCCGVVLAMVARGVAAETDGHWAFRPIERPVVPAANGGSPIDRFIRARLAARGLKPSPAATESVQVRRVTLDLTGLLPAVDGLAQQRPDRWERLVDRLLASPHFGERWGRHWLDLARYADSAGYESDAPRQIWPYRDWVIAALNADMTFDRFVTEQLAGDLLPGAGLSQRIATGFACNVMLAGGVRYEAIVDQVQTTGAVFLGLTLGCAQCHEHKTDPVSHEEFYRLFAFFNGSVIERLPLPGFDAGYRDGTIRRPDADGKKPAVPSGPATLVVKAAPQPTHVLLQGDPRQPGEKVTTGFPAFLKIRWRADDAGAAKTPPTRIDLARWILSYDNPLTDRVTVNRVWQRLFGSGLVETENDFGIQTAPPLHPELLDFLAVEFRHGRRSLKKLIRLIVHSETYRQSSARRDELDAIDAGNRLVGRQRRLRLETEVIRDVCLQAGGLLSEKMGGPSVFPDQAAGVLDARATPAKWIASRGEDRLRRGLYTWHWRLTPHPLLPLFDAPDGVTACTRRDRSNVPVQALALLNDGAFFEAARGLGGWAWHRRESDDRRVNAIFFRCLGRSPTRPETGLVLQLLSRQRATLAGEPLACRQLLGLEPPEKVRTGSTDLVERAAWVLVARVVLNLDEFITRE